MVKSVILMIHTNAGLSSFNISCPPTFFHIYKITWFSEYFNSLMPGDAYIYMYTHVYELVNWVISRSGNGFPTVWSPAIT